MVRPKGDLFMPKCTTCDLTFNDAEEAKQHVHDQHSDKVDEKLMEYMEEAIEEAAEELIDYGDEV